MESSGFALENAETKSIQELAVRAALCVLGFHICVAHFFDAGHKFGGESYYSSYFLSKEELVYKGLVFKIAISSRF